MGIFDWLFPKSVTEAPTYLDPMVWQHAFAISVIGIFFLVLGLVMLYPKTPLPYGNRFRFVAMLGFVLLGVLFLMGVFA
jgi:hypothetical protein